MLFRSFDPAGNRTQTNEFGPPDPAIYDQFRTDADVNQYSLKSWTGMLDPIGYMHDNNGNLSARGQVNTDPDDGYPTGLVDGEAFEYDYRNRLVRIATETGAEIAAYRYDALGRRISKTVGGTTTRYVYDG